VILRRYTPQDQTNWNQFVKAAKNGTFLFQRTYMDYHSDRFPDHSLVAMSDSGRWIAVLPACEQDKNFCSHAGLTYGGWVTNRDMTCPEMLIVFRQLIAYLANAGFDWLNYKTVPHIYHRLPAEEDSYALFRHNATLCRRDTLSVLDLRAQPLIQARRMRGAKKAFHQSVRIQLEQHSPQAYADFWQCLQVNLQAQFQAEPTHSLAEIQALKELHPGQICLHTAQVDGQLCAGVLVYLAEPVCHVQYISASPAGKKVAALDFLLLEIINHYRAHKQFSYFDFGISNEENGRYLNLGLIEQKEGFGARTVVHDFYQLSVSSAFEPRLNN
jgi:hypothetical protein